LLFLLYRLLSPLFFYLAPAGHQCQVAGDGLIRRCCAALQLDV